jgi:hypothetical protein
MKMISVAIMYTTVIGQWMIRACTDTASAYGMWAHGMTAVGVKTVGKAGE